MPDDPTTYHDQDGNPLPEEMQRQLRAESADARKRRLATARKLAERTPPEEPRT
jgi:hypothetical protein